MTAGRNSRVSYVAPPSPGPHDGKRLSPWRVLLGILIVAAVGAGSVFGYEWLTTREQARAQVAAPWFAAYVDVTATPPYPFESPSRDVQRDVVLAFVVAAAADQCRPSWGAAYSLDEAGADLDLDRRIARLRQQGGDVVVSFGGAINTELATACQDSATLRDAYAAVIDRYDVSTIDLDVEKDDLEDQAAGLRRAVALADLQAQRRAAGQSLAIWLTLPVMPTGLTDDGVTAVRQMLSAGVDLAGVNVMTMDYGVDLEGASMAEASTDAISATHDQLASLYADHGFDLADVTLWAKLGATPMIGQNDVPSEVFTLADAARLNAFAQEKGLGRMSMWSLARDRTCGQNYADVRVVSDACSGIEQGEQTFAEALSPGFSAPPDASADQSTTPEPTVLPSDDPATSPYPVWSATSTYLAGTKVVRHGNVYVAKWWTRGDIPDDPTVRAADSPWTIVGPVLPGETPLPQPTVPAGVLPEWDGAATYQAGDRVVFEGMAFEAKWWTQGESPAAVSSDPDRSPWVPLTVAQIKELAGG